MDLSSFRSRPPVLLPSVPPPSSCLFSLVVSSSGFLSLWYSFPLVLGFLFIYSLLALSLSLSLSLSLLVSPSCPLSFRFLGFFTLSALSPSGSLYMPDPLLTALTLPTSHCLSCWIPASFAVGSGSLLSPHIDFSDSVNIKKKSKQS